MQIKGNIKIERREKGKTDKIIVVMAQLGLTGDGYTIKNFKINTTDFYTGLFRYAKSAKFKNLVIKKGELKQPASALYVGALAGFVNGGSLTGCTVRGNTTVVGISYVGGLIGG